MAKKNMSTFEKEMQNSTFKKKFTKAYEALLLSEIMIALMESEGKSVRKLAAEAGVSPTIVQKMRSGKQDDIKLSNFINISHACGFHVLLEKDGEKLYL